MMIRDDQLLAAIREEFGDNRPFILLYPPEFKEGGVEDGLVLVTNRLNRESTLDVLLNAAAVVESDVPGSAVSGRHGPGGDTKH